MLVADPLSADKLYPCNGLVYPRPDRFVAAPTGIISPCERDIGEPTLHSGNSALLNIPKAYRQDHWRGGLVKRCVKRAQAAALSHIPHFSAAISDNFQRPTWASGTRVRAHGGGRGPDAGGR